ncbi:Hint domain-containing protein [Actibacterium ureilyticum]|uniref:Hint domain-containing protein n=1 Tax=Actibacterium ureilyticum TaxID=1590614 RepID=UPI000BAAE423|nr:Hint domain-containing protein [Actibacterium ureilyticum]
MVYPRPAAHGAASANITPRKTPSARLEHLPQRNTPITRRYEVRSLTPEGEQVDFMRVAPATPVFEDAFAGFARGTLFSTESGPVAIEDLQPGMMLETGRAGMQPVLWVGSMTVYPGAAGQSTESATLTRITADSFGLGRPMPDLMLGARARLLYKGAGCQEMFGSDAGFAPARAFVDGISAIRIQPAAPVRVYHLALHGQQIVMANGLEVETYHPGQHADMMVEPEIRDIFLGLFPHVRSLSDFGMMPLPRMTAFELENLRAGV